MIISATEKEKENMEKIAITKYVRISPFKAREVTRLIQGKSAVSALNMVRLIPRKAARLIEQTLKSAVANAENDDANGVDRSKLFVKEAAVGEGPTMRRFRPKARGSAGRIRKRSSHIRIIVSNKA
ncbi:MAG: 50S ribosomal protein L22 [Lentisphaeria bacterium]